MELLPDMVVAESSGRVVATGRAVEVATGVGTSQSTGEGVVAARVSSTGTLVGDVHAPMKNTSKNNAMNGRTWVKLRGTPAGN